MAKDGKRAPERRKLLQVVVSVEAPAGLTMTEFKASMRSAAEGFLTGKGDLAASAAKRRSGVRKFP